MSRNKLRPWVPTIYLALGMMWTVLFFRLLFIYGSGLMWGAGAMACWCLCRFITLERDHRLITRAQPA